MLSEGASTWSSHGSITAFASPGHQLFKVKLREIKQFTPAPARRASGVGMVALWCREMWVQLSYLDGHGIPTLLVPKSIHSDPLLWAVGRGPSPTQLERLGE